MNRNELERLETELSALMVREQRAKTLKAEQELETARAVHEAVKNAILTRTDLPNLGGVN